MKKEFKTENIRFLDSVNYIDDKFISEVLAEVKVPHDGTDNAKPRRAWKQIAVFAACMVLLGALFPIVTKLIGRAPIEPGGNPGGAPIQTTLPETEAPPETEPAETEPAETEELFSPIPQSELDFIERVGEVPAEFKKLVENDTFGGLRKIGDRFYYTDKKDGFHYIVFVDKWGRETAVKTIEANKFSDLFVDSKGNYLAVYSTGMDYSYILVKFDSSGNIIFNTYCKTPVGASLDKMIEVDGGYIFVGQINVKSTLVNLTVTDIVITKITSLGKIEGSMQFGGNDHDTVKHVEKTADGVSVYFYMRDRGEQVTSTLQRYDFDKNCNLISKAEVKEHNVPSENEPLFTVNGKPYYKTADFFTEYDWDRCFSSKVIEYDDFMLIVYYRYTSDFRMSTHGMLSTLGPNVLYRESVYAAYSKDGELIWRSSVDATNYELLKMLFDN